MDLDWRTASGPSWPDQVLIVDDEHYTRKVIRTLLLSIGCTKIHEANDGTHGLEAIARSVPTSSCSTEEMPGIDGPAFVRKVRSPARFHCRACR